MKKHTLFISDLHLTEKQPKIAQAFLSFLQADALQADALYILGDFFDAWIGDDDQTSFNLSIIDGLKKFNDTGVPTYFMRGNHDFMIGEQFAKLSKCQLIDDPTVIPLYGKQVLLMHGDSLCSLDREHQRFRKIVNHPLFQKVALKLPKKMRHKIAKKLLDKGHDNISLLPEHIRDVAQQSVIDSLLEHGTDTLIHGHTHRPDVHQLTLNPDTAGVRIVLGAWFKAGKGLIWHDDGTYQLQDFAE